MVALREERGIVQRGAQQRHLQLAEETLRGAAHAHLALQIVEQHRHQIDGIALHRCQLRGLAVLAVAAQLALQILAQTLRADAGLAAGGHGPRLQRLQRRLHLFASGVGTITAFVDLAGHASTLRQELAQGIEQGHLIAARRFGGQAVLANGATESAMAGEAAVIRCGAGVGVSVATAQHRCARHHRAARAWRVAHGITCGARTCCRRWC